MSGISIKFSQISQQVVAIVVRMAGGAFLTGGKAGFTLSGATLGVAVTSDTIRFTPVFPGSGAPNVDLSISMPAGADSDPVIEIDTELSMFAGVTGSQPLFPGQSPNTPSLLGGPQGIGIGAVVGTTLGRLLPFAQSPMGVGSPTFQPPAPTVEQAITVGWQTATEWRSEPAAVGVPLTLAGYAG